MARREESMHKIMGSNHAVMHNFAHSFTLVYTQVHAFINLFIGVCKCLCLDKCVILQYTAKKMILKGMDLLLDLLREKPYKTI